MGEHYNYVEPSKGGVVLNNKAENAHAILDKGNPKVNGPYLDDIRSEQEVDYRKRRKNALKRTAKKAVSKKASAKPQKKASAKKTTVAKKSTAKKSTSKK